MGPLAFKGFGWNYKYTAADFGYQQFPRPLQAAQVAIPQPGIDRKQCHNGEMIWQSP
jgi:hypothetical protein